MTKEEILAKSVEDNKHRDEMEKNVFFKSGQVACAIGGLIAALLVTLDPILTGKENFGAMAIFLSMTGTMLIAKYLKLKKTLRLIFGIIQLIAAIIFLIIHFLNL